MHCDLDLQTFDPKVDRANPWLMVSVPVKFHEDRCKGEAVMRMKPFYLTMHILPNQAYFGIGGGEGRMYFSVVFIFVFVSLCLSMPDCDIDFCS